MIVTGSFARVGAFTLATALSQAAAQAPRGGVPQRQPYTASAVIDSTVRRVMGERDIPGAAVAFLRGDTVVHARGYGVAERRRGTPVTTETVFQIASLTKPLTATAVLLLVDEGRLDLDAPASRYLDWLPDRYRAVTVRQLLMHTSGVAPDVRRANVEEMSEAEFRQRLLDRPASFTPGAGFQYANAGYTLLSQIVEQVTGQTFGAYLEGRVFEPLRMRRSAYRQPPSSDGRHAIGYDLVDSSLQEAPHVFSGWGNSGIETTVEDLSRWAQALDRRELLNASSYRQMFSAGRLSADTALNFPFRGARAAYGLGWFLTTHRGDSLITHGGAIAGFSSALHRLPVRRWTIIVLSNKKQGADRQGEAEAIAGAVLEALRSESDRLSAVRR